MSNILFSVRQEILGYRELPLLAKLILQNLLSIRYMTGENPECTETHFQNKFGVREGSVKKSMMKLIEKGFISDVRYAGRTMSGNRILLWELNLQKIGDVFFYDSDDWI